MTPQASTFCFEEPFSAAKGRAVRIDRSIARYPMVAEELVQPRESLSLRVRKTWLGDFCYELPGWFQSFFWGIRIAVRMTGRKS